jgi:hypothetical protein
VRVRDERCRWWSFRLAFSEIRERQGRSLTSDPRHWAILFDVHKIYDIQYVLHALNPLILVEESSHLKELS